MALELERSGAVLVPEREAGVIIVNTCAVTGEAEAKTRKAVRHAASLPGQPLVIATGCVANLFADEISALAPNVRVERDKAAVAALAASALSLEQGCGAPVPCDAPTPTGRTRPGIKIQDGCDNRCTYCIVWRARGAARSMLPEEVLAAVRAAQERGAHEVVLTGINLGSYRAASEGGDELGLPGLLDLLLTKTDVERIRLSSIEPPDVTDELCRTMAAAGERMAPFLHVCLQSGCDETLRRMARVYRTDAFRRVVETAREHLPHVALGTDLIVGFPGETDDDFERSLEFCREMRFATPVVRGRLRPRWPVRWTPTSWPSAASVPAHSPTRCALPRRVARWAPGTSSSCSTLAAASPEGSSTSFSTRRSPWTASFPCASRTSTTTRRSWPSCCRVLSWRAAILFLTSGFPEITRRIDFFRITQLGI